MWEVGVGTKGLKDFSRENEALVSTEEVFKDIERHGGKRKHAHSDPTNRTVELKHRDRKQWLRGRKIEAEEPGKLTASHTELGLQPADNRSQGRLLENERHNV